MPAPPASDIPVALSPNSGTAQSTVTSVTSHIMIMPRVTRPAANRYGRSRCISRYSPKALTMASEAEISSPMLNVPNSGTASNLA